MDVDEPHWLRGLLPVDARDALLETFDDVERAAGQAAGYCLPPDQVEEGLDAGRLLTLAWSAPDWTGAPAIDDRGKRDLRLKDAKARLRIRNRPV